jgi:tetratricopeptide (TPR) repeat protein
VSWPLPPLPKFIEIPLAKPGAEELERLDGLIDALTAPASEARRAARRQVSGVDTSWLPAIAQRLDRVADTANKPALKQLFETIREQARAEQQQARKAQGKSGVAPTPDYLDMLVEHRDRSSPYLRALSEVVAYSRLLEQIGNLDAARRLVSIYIRFGEFLRVDTQFALARLGDRSVAALIEATGYPVERIVSWAERQLAEQDKLAPSDAVQVSDPALRADILRAYGKLRRLDAANLLVSYSSSELGLTRSAAREALTRLGEAGLWPLREGYEKTVGERAPKEWSWQRVARELFARFDQLRLAEVYRLFEQGTAAQRRGNFELACSAFDRALVRDPLFERGVAMADTFLRCATLQAESNADQAMLWASRAERLGASGPVHDRAQSLRQTLEARALFARGLGDQTLLERARELDPDNQRAEALLETIRADSRPNTSGWQRYLGALVILGVAALGLLLLNLRQRYRENG